jgi:hypothetical protein
LGDVARRLYLQRLRSNGDYDLLAFCSDFVLENRQERAVRYFVVKEESFTPPIKQLTVDHQVYPYERDGNFITFKLVMSPKASSRIYIEYESDTDLSAIDLGKSDLRVAMLRKLSDFRDMQLSTSTAGRGLVNFYYASGLSRWGLANLAIGLSILLISIVWGGWRIRKRLKHARAQA